MIKTVTARELQEKISKKNLHLLDVREKVEYAMGHVPTAVNLPLSEFVSSYQTLDKDKVYHIICQSGSRSEPGSSFLISTRLSSCQCRRWHIRLDRSIGILK